MIDLDLAKQHLRVLGEGEDMLIWSYVQAAQAMIEGKTGKLFTRREVVQPTATLGCADGPWAPLWWGPDPVFAAGQGIDYLDADGVAQSVVAPRLNGFRVYPPIGGWPVRVDYTPVAITYTAGYDETDGSPETARALAELGQAQLMLVAHWYLNREAAGSAAATNEMPLAVADIVQRHRNILI